MTKRSIARIPDPDRRRAGPDAPRAVVRKHRRRLTDSLTRAAQSFHSRNPDPVAMEGGSSGSLMNDVLRHGSRGSRARLAAVFDSGPQSRHDEGYSINQRTWDEEVEGWVLGWNRNQGYGELLVQKPAISTEGMMEGTENEG